MTAQAPETLLYEGKEHHLFTEPLRDYLDEMGDQVPKLTGGGSACWRGYRGTWEITDDRLYLIEISALIRHPDIVAHASELHYVMHDGLPPGWERATLAHFFPGARDRVFANWYSGILRIPLGEQLIYVHMGYSSIYERDLFIEIEQGMVTRRWEQNNRPGVEAFKKLADIPEDDKTTGGFLITNLVYNLAMQQDD